MYVYTICVTLCVSVSVSVYPSVRPSVRPSVCLSVCLFILKSRIFIWGATGGANVLAKTDSHAISPLEAAMLSENEETQDLVVSYLEMIKTAAADDDDTR